MSEVVTLSIFKYKQLKDQLWAFGMMQFAHRDLTKEKECSFYKLMGSGKENFNPLPDWSVYALLQVWDDAPAATKFFNSSKLFQRYRKHSSEVLVLHLHPIQSHGKWNGQMPFQIHKKKNEKAMIAAITRASIKKSKLRTFWKYVPRSQEPLHRANGLIYTKGFGEVPITEMATFSIWEKEDDLKNYAYKSREHAEAIKKTRKLNWYKEEMFSRYEIIDMFGSWESAKVPAEMFKPISQIAF